MANLAPRLNKSSCGLSTSPMTTRKPLLKTSANSHPPTLQWITGSSTISTMTERTLILIKPDGVANGHVGEIIARIERKGLKLVELDLRPAVRETAEKHYEEHP